MVRLQPTSIKELMSVKGKLSSRLSFHDWETVLQQSTVPPHRQESMGITIRWYLSWAKRARVPVDFDSARDFITQVELEKRPSPHRLEQWKEALRWLFREGGGWHGRQRGLHSDTAIASSPGHDSHASSS